MASGANAAAGFLFAAGLITHSPKIYMAGWVAWAAVPCLLVYFSFRKEVKS